MSKFPRQVRIVASNNDWGHGFPVGDIATATESYGGEDGAIEAYIVNGNGDRISQLLTPRDFEELDAVQPAQNAEQKEVSARVKYLYSVETDDGTKITSTQDREYARELKAHLGGKKEGIVIMAYAPVKEIR